MKDAFAQQAEQQDEMMIGFNGQRMLTPDAMQRKMLRDQIRAQEVSRSIILPGGKGTYADTRCRKRESDRSGSTSSLRTSRTAC